MVVIVAKVKHVWHYAERGALIPEETVVLQREPNNEHDSNAVKVLRKHLDTGRLEHVGYIEREKAESVCKRMDEYACTPQCTVVPPLNPVQGVLKIEWLI